MTHKMTFQTEPARRRIEKIQHLLRGQDLSIAEISEEIHLTLYWARAYINHLHATKQVYIARYQVRKQQHYDRQIALYCWGEATDAIKPAAMNYLEKAHKRRAIIAADPDLQDKEAAKRRAKRTVPARDWTASWIPTKTQGAL